MSTVPAATPESPVCSVHAPPPVHSRGETNTRWVTGLTFAMMIAELVAGYLSHSLALTADGWHMATHVGALGLSALAYWYARTRASETRFAFGTGKVYALAGYSSAGFLLLVAFSMIWQGAERFWHPETVDFADAFPVAVIGLVVNLISAKLLEVGSGPAPVGHVHPGHSHGPEHTHGDHGHEEHAHDGHAHEGHSHGHDHALRAAYLHVIADALTSVAAIVALVSGRYFGLWWVDPVVAIVGALVILKWGITLCGECARQLVDLDPSTTLRDRVRAALESMDDTRVEDLHLWRVGPGALVCVVSVSSTSPQPLEAYKDVATKAAPIDHLTVEICARPRPSA